MKTIINDKREAKSPEKTYSIGMWFKKKDGEEVAVLAQVDAGKVALIDVADPANRYYSPCPVQNNRAMTSLEIEDIFRKKFDQWQQIQVEINILENL